MKKLSVEIHAKVVFCQMKLPKMGKLSVEKLMKSSILSDETAQNERIIRRKSHEKLCSVR